LSLAHTSEFSLVCHGFISLHHQENAITQGIQLIVKLGPVADMAHFSHRSTVVSNYSRPAFLL